MDKKEVVEIMKGISTFYGGKFKVDDPQAMVNSWHSILKDYDFTEINENLKEYVKAHPFPPSVAELLKVAAAKDRAIPTYEETQNMFERWEQGRSEAVPKEVADDHLAEMRKILGIDRG